jgi:hypothetical protein
MSTAHRLSPMQYALRLLPGLVFALGSLHGTQAWSRDRAQVLVGAQSHMVYRVVRKKPGLAMTWIGREFDDADWTPGVFPVGIETGKAVGARALIRTRVDEPASSIYCRTKFELEDPSAVESLYLGVDYDDGFVAWINGVEVARSESMPAGKPRWNARPSSHESSNSPQPRFHPRHDLSRIGIPALREGQNVLAVGTWNSEPDSSDLVLAVELLANQPLKTFVTRGPYLQLATDTAVTVRWRTDRPTDSLVSYGSEPGHLAGTVGDPVATTDHRIRLTGLEPDSTVFYAVGTSTTMLAGDDAEHVFRTAPPPGSRRPIRFWVVGDAGSAGGIPGWVRASFESYDDVGRTDLWLTVGDNAYGGGTDERYQFALFDTFARMLRRASVWSTPGNHEDGAYPQATYYDVFEFPTRGEAGGVPSGTESYYSFDFGNVHFVSLNSEDADLSRAGPMVSWLRRDLKATEADWIVAFWHRAPYSGGLHDSDKDPRAREIRANVLPVLDEYGANLVLAGHSHSCQRSFLLRGHYGESASLRPSMVADGDLGRPGEEGPYHTSVRRRGGDGIVYAIVGCSGEATDKDFGHPVLAAHMDDPGSLIVDVDGLRLDARYVDYKGRVRDHFAIVRDETAAGAEPGLDGERR